MLSVFSVILEHRNYGRNSSDTPTVNVFVLHVQSAPRHFKAITEHAFRRAQMLNYTRRQK